jgi:ribosomal protein S18 acetylase RimI-like enzyme
MTTTLTNDHQRARIFLESNRLRHLAHLKFLNYYGTALDCFYSETEAETGILLSHPVSLIAWDHTLYPEVNWVLLPVASGEKAAQRLLDHVESLSHIRGKLLVKFCDPLTKQFFSDSFDLHHARTLISFTTSQFQAPASVWDNVKVARQADDAQVALYLENGYTRAELERYFADGAQSFTIYEQGQAVCSCLAYRNFDTVWEIGALHTLAQARRKGYARMVVSAALETLLADGQIARYVAENTNTASIRLAQSLGMQPCLHFEHYLTDTQPPT